MTDPETAGVVRLAELANLVLNSVITVGEAVSRVRRDPALLAGAIVPAMADGVWEVVRQKRIPGCLIAGLLHEWSVAHAKGDPVAIHTSGRMFVRAASEVLITRDDGDLYRRAHAAADRMISVAPAASLWKAHYIAGFMHLAPYAIDPVNAPQDYAVGRRLRAMREMWSWPVHTLPEQVMPEPAVGLDRAVRHLMAAADGATGRERGAALTHWAFAEYSRFLAGSGDLTTVDGLCDEAATLLPPTDEALACNRLLMLELMRQRVGPRAGRPIVVPPLDDTTNGAAYTALVAVTIVRLLIGMYRADEAREIIRTAWPLVADDPDLRAQRFFLGWASAHGLPGDPVGCRVRLEPTPRWEQRQTAATAAVDRVHALMCTVPVHDTAAEDEAVAAVRTFDPRLKGRLDAVLAYRRWMNARVLVGRQDGHAVPALIDAVIAFVSAGNEDLAGFALATLVGVVHGMPLEAFADLAGDRGMLGEIVRMVDTVFVALPEAGGRDVVTLLSRLLAGWAHIGQTRRGEDVLALQYILAVLQLRKGRAFAGVLTRPGPAAPDAEIAEALVLYTKQHADPGDPPDGRSLRATIVGDDEGILNSYLHSAERERGSTAVQRQANLRRRAQAADTERLMVRASAAPHHDLGECFRALPDNAALLNVCTGAVGPNGRPGYQAMLLGQGLLRLACLNTSGPLATQLGADLNEIGAGTRIFPPFGLDIARLRRALVDDPLHRNVTRAAEQDLTWFAESLFPEVLEQLVEFAARHTQAQLVFWPHESLYFLPLHLLPVRDGILADHFTVTVLPSLECLFQEQITSTTTRTVQAIACATGGLAVGLPAEPSLHEQAERIARLFGTRPLLGAEATPAGARAALGTSRYLHLAAHGAQDVHAPLFARIYMAGGALHAHEILNRDLRGTELVTLSACESALLRYDFLGNLHGLASAFLRAGARAVIGALWPVGPEVAATFFIALYACLANGGTRVDAFQLAQNTARAHHPNYRDWGAFTYFGS